MKTVNNISQLHSYRKTLRNNATPQEILLWNQLKNSKLGFKFRRQHSIGTYIADFYCTQKKLVIEIDGSQHYKEEDQEYDIVRTQYFNSLGIKVLRFTNTEINTNMNGVISKIQSEF